MIKNPQSTKEEEIEILPEKCCNDKIIMKNDSKDDPKSWKNKMELQINTLETRIEKMQEMFNKDLEEVE